MEVKGISGLFFLYLISLALTALGSQGGLRSASSSPKSSSSDTEKRSYPPSPLSIAVSTSEDRSSEEDSTTAGGSPSVSFSRPARTAYSLERQAWESEQNYDARVELHADVSKILLELDTNIKAPEKKLSQPFKLTEMITTDRELYKAIKGAFENKQGGVLERLQDKVPTSDMQVKIIMLFCQIEEELDFSRYCLHSPIQQSTHDHKNTRKSKEKIE